ncbi:unnamed protein product, partial [Prunus brigantina]
MVTLCMSTFCAYSQIIASNLNSHVPRRLDHVVSDQCVYAPVLIQLASDAFANPSLMITQKQ